MGKPENGMDLHMESARGKEMEETRKWKRPEHGRGREMEEARNRRGQNMEEKRTRETVRRSFSGYSRSTFTDFVIEPGGFPVKGD